MLIQLENNELINIPKEKEFRIFLREESGRHDLMVTTAESEYEIIHGMGEGAGDEFSEIIREMYMHYLCNHVITALSGQDKLIDVMSIYDEIADYLQSLVQNKSEEEKNVCKLLVEQDNVELLLMPRSKAHTTEADFLEQQLCYLEGACNDEDLSANRVNTAFVELIKDRSLQLISSSQTPKETQNNLVLNYVKVCYFGENSMVQSYFTKAEGLNMLRQHELLFDFMTFIESEFPDIEPSWKNELVCRYYNRKVSEESFD